MSKLNKTNHLFSVAPAFVNNILDAAFSNETQLNELFNYQYCENAVYRQWCQAMGHSPGCDVTDPTLIPYLPISFFKTHVVKTGSYEPETIFTSSGTTQTLNSRHYVRDLALYKQTFLRTFEMFYGSIQNWCVIGLLPSYLERSGSSLVVMVDELIKQCDHKQSGFYLNEFEQLHQLLQQLDNSGQPVLLIGVTFALLDFAAAFPMQLQHTVVMETGGMKGRKKEQTRQEVHGLLQQQLGLPAVHAEYGMTELMSQAYSKGDGIYRCPPWMQVLVRDEEDPLAVKRSGRGVLNVIDFANVYSCAFIATDDVGMVHEDGSFEVWGRMDTSDIRGCSLLVV